MEWFYVRLPSHWLWATCSRLRSPASLNCPDYVLALSQGTMWTALFGGWIVNTFPSCKTIDQDCFSWANAYRLNHNTSILLGLDLQNSWTRTTKGLHSQELHHDAYFLKAVPYSKTWTATCNLVKHIHFNEQCEHRHQTLEVCSLFHLHCLYLRLFWQDKSLTPAGNC